MTSLLGRVFSDRFANRGAVEHNLLLLTMYRFAYPFARIFNAAGLTPNQLTALSFIAACGAAAALVARTPPWLFMVCWGLSVLLDFCDGTVARMSGRVSRSAFRLDHMSDLAKVSLLLIVTGWRHQGSDIALLSYGALFTFLYYSIINQELKAVRQLLLLEDSPSIANRNAPSFQQSLPKALRISYTALSTINGHTLLIFLLLPISTEWVAVVLLYLSAVAGYGSIIRIRSLLALPKPSSK